MLSLVEIEQKIKAVLVQALNIDEREIEPESIISYDLNAESIDFLDIIFRLEREFAIKIPRLSLFPDNILRGSFEEDLLYVDMDKRIITEEGVALLLERYPDIDVKILGSPPKRDSLPDLFTYGYVVRYITRRLQENKE